MVPVKKWDTELAHAVEELKMYESMEKIQRRVERAAKATEEKTQRKTLEVED